MRISSGLAVNSSGERKDTCTGRSASTSRRSAVSTAEAKSALIPGSSKSIRARSGSILPPVTSAPWSRPITPASMCSAVWVRISE